jgi:riboflavin synthase
MFSGIVSCMGEVTRAQEVESGRELVIRSEEISGGLGRGASVAVNGVCLTSVEHDARTFRSEVLRETLRATNLGDLREGDRVNLEPSLRYGDEIGGHLVQGHVDGVAEVTAVREEELDWRVDFALEPALLGYLVPKGSVALDGVSMTVGPELGETEFHVFVIPHTRKATRFASYRPGSRVNVEVDILGKYVRHYLREEAERGAPRTASPKGPAS